MPKRPGSRLAALFSRVFHFRFWLDVDRVKKFTQYIIDLFQRLFVPSPKAPEESFDDALKRLNITPEQLFKRQRMLFRMSILMLVCAVLLFFYGLYEWFYGGILGVLLTVVVIFIALTLAFRYHFWYFQMKERKLGCSWKTWLNEGLLGGKKV